MVKYEENHDVEIARDEDMIKEHEIQNMARIKMKDEEDSDNKETLMKKEIVPSSHELKVEDIVGRRPEDLEKALENKKKRRFKNF